MGSTTRSVLVNIAAFFADNNIRRTVANFEGNYVTSGGSANVTYQTVGAGTLFTYVPSQTPTSILILNASAPVLATLNVPQLVLNGVTRSSTSVQLVVNGNLIIDDQVTQVTLQNPWDYDIQISFIQG